MKNNNLGRETEKQMWEKDKDSNPGTQTQVLI